MPYDEELLHGHETRLVLLERNGERQTEQFASINDKLEEIHDDIVTFKVEHAEEKGKQGWKGVLGGASAGGAVWGIAKLVAWIHGK